MEFKKFKLALQNNFESMSKDVKHLFEVDVDKEQMWSLYLDSFPEGTNEIFNERREYDCSCCRHFLKSIGNAVKIEDGEVTTIWDFETNSTTFKPVTEALSSYLKSRPINDVWVNKFDSLGTNTNREVSENGKVIEWNHLYLKMPKTLVNKSVKSEAEVKGEFRSAKDVFKRSLEELTEDSISTVLELIAQGSLYKGDEWKGQLTDFLKLKKEFLKLPLEDRDVFAWEKSINISPVLSRIRNTSIGTLLIDISEGLDLDESVRKYEAIVAPENYKRSKPLFTKRMLEDAQKTINELGFEDSLARRFATLDDITVNNILFSNKDSAKKIGGNDIFSEMLSEVSAKPKNYSKVEEIGIEEFISNVLPTTRELEVLLENKYSPNMVSLIAPVNKDSKSMFKWDNSFGWAYSGNITDSSMRDNVKSAGGSVDGVLRFSIQWNDTERNPNDFDAHCTEPDGFDICFYKKNSAKTGGSLDVDIINPIPNKPAVENITWGNKSKMADGKYQFYVHNYSNKGGRDGFKAEIEFGGEIFSFEYNKELRTDAKVPVATVTLKNGVFSIKEDLPSSTSSREIWGLKSNQFVPVSVLMNSPNHWNGNATGNKHYMFMLKDCINPEMPNGYYVEFLKEDLVKHRKVFESLGSKMRVQDSDNQLSGLGFSSTRRNEVIVKVKGNIERTLKIKF